MPVRETKKSLPRGLLQPLAIPSRSWISISMDFIEGLPTSQGFDYLWVIVYQLTKLNYFVHLSPPYTTSKLAQQLLKHLFRLHGMPNEIISDRDKTFTNKF